MYSETVRMIRCLAMHFGVSSFFLAISAHAANAEEQTPAFSDIASYLPALCTQGGHSFAAGGYQVRYDKRGEWAVVEEDIIVGRASEEAHFTDSAFYGASVLPLFKGVPQTWIGGIVPYEYSGLPQGIRTKVAIAMTEFRAQTENHFNFIKKANTDKDYVRIQYAAGLCNAYIGRIGGVQFMNLGDGCTVGDIMHELGHAVGLHHEHNRLDRDKYIKINWNNIKSREERAFCPIRKERDQNIGKYDFDSIMHYPWWAFGKKVANNKTLVTIQAATGVGVKIKSRIDPSLSSGDRYTLAKLYGWPVTPLTPDSSTGGGGQTSISCTADGEVAVKYEKNHEDTKFWLASGARVRIVKAERDERHRLWYQIRDKYGRVGWTLRQWLRCT